MADFTPVLLIIRGLPGSGKTTLAHTLAGKESSVAADDYFDVYEDGVFNPKKLQQAHSWCQDVVDGMMGSAVPMIAVHNTFTQEWEMKPYETLAEDYGYRVHHIVVENRHGNDSVHNVPEQTIEKMRNRFDIKI